MRGTVRAETLRSLAKAQTSRAPCPPIRRATNRWSARDLDREFGNCMPTKGACPIIRTDVKCAATARKLVVAERPRAVSESR